MTPPIVISALHYDWSDAADALRWARDVGLQGVEFSLNPGFQRPHCTADDLALLADPAVRGDMLLDAHIWDDIPHIGAAAGIEALRSWLPRCRAAGITGVVLHGGSHPDRAAGLAIVREALAETLPEFAAAGVALKLENHYAYDYRGQCELFSEPWEFAELLEDLPSPALRTCFDTGHGHMTRNWEGLICTMAPTLAHVHLADNGGIDDDHCPYGLGTVPFAAMFDLLHEVGFAGAFCVEFPARDDLAPFRQCLHDIAARWRD
jgi:sugar phosphate isomerase/epimerase